MNVTTQLLNTLTGKKQAPEAEESERRNDPWYAYRNRPISGRAVRRARHAEMVRLTRKYHHNVARSEQDFNKISMLEAVRRVRRWEIDNGPTLAFLVEHEIVPSDTTSLDTIGVADLLGLLEEKDENNAEAAR